MRSSPATPSPVSLRRVSCALGGVFASAALALFGASDLAAQERPETPDPAAVYAALGTAHRSFAACATEARDKAIADMWARSAPIDSALYDISHAVRNCEGFANFWSALYFSGFDSPEDWIAVDIQLLKTAALKRLETTRETVSEADAFLGRVRRSAQENNRLDRDSRRETLDELSRLREAVRAANPTEVVVSAETLETLAETAETDIFSLLPEEAETALEAALKLEADRREGGGRNVVQRAARGVE